MRVTFLILPGGKLCHNARILSVLLYDHQEGSQARCGCRAEFSSSAGGTVGLWHYSCLKIRKRLFRPIDVFVAD